MAIMSTGILEDGRNVVSLIPFSILFSDKTFIPACTEELSNKMTPIKKEKIITLNNGMKTVKVYNELSDLQKEMLVLLQHGGRIVLCPRTILDALNENPEERMEKFSFCVGQRATELTAKCHPAERIVDIDCWMY